MSGYGRAGIVLAALAAAAGAARAQGAEQDWDDRAVAGAVERAVGYLWSKQEDGFWPATGENAPRGNEAGLTALCAQALLAAGVSPHQPRMKRALERLAAAKTDSTYTRAVRACVWATVGSRSRYGPNLKDDVRHLVLGADDNGAYDYVPIGRGPQARIPAAGGAWDNSNSQMAVLGVWAGQEAGVDVPAGYWQLVHDHWKRCQGDDGGWCYQEKGPSYGSMSVAGLATMFICFDALYSDQFAKCLAETDYPPIERGLKWLDRNFSAETNPGLGTERYHYYLYGVERVGLASGYKYFGGKDWYKLGAQALLATQGENGGWRDPVKTAFAVLFLARGRHPVLFNKLRYEGDWNSRPRDLANFTRWASRHFERTVNWQIVDLNVPVRELHDAPILYISGASAPTLSKQDVAKLREFVLQGGMILSESACNSAAFTLAMGKIYTEMFPLHQLKRLPADHPIYDQHFEVGAERRSLWGVSNGVRMLAIHAPAELSLAWQLRRELTDSDTFKLGANIYLYVTDKEILPPRGVARWPAAKAFAPAETVRVARVKYAGDFDPEPLAWKRFAILMGNQHGVNVEVGEPVEMPALDAARTPVAAMTGVTAFTLSDAERTGLRKFLQAGGTLIVDAAGGSEAFATAAEKEFAALLGPDALTTLPAGHAVFTSAGPKIETIAWRRALRDAGRSKDRAVIRAFQVNGRAAILLCPDDLTAGLVGYAQWGLKGYKPETAFALMRNMVLYAAGRKLPAAGHEPAPASDRNW